MRQRRGTQEGAGGPGAERGHAQVRGLAVPSSCSAGGNGQSRRRLIRWLPQNSAARHERVAPWTRLVRLPACIHTAPPGHSMLVAAVRNTGLRWHALPSCLQRPGVCLEPCPPQQAEPRVCGAAASLDPAGAFRVRSVRSVCSVHSSAVGVYGQAAAAQQPTLLARSAASHQAEPCW